MKVYLLILSPIDDSTVMAVSFSLQAAMAKAQEVMALKSLTRGWEGNHPWEEAPIPTVFGIEVPGIEARWHTHANHTYLSVVSKETLDEPVKALVTLEQARAAKEAILSVRHTEVSIGITRVGEDYGVKMNHVCPLAHPLPSMVDGVPIQVEAVGMLTTR